jgi:hypothetical protein
MKTKNFFAILMIASALAIAVVVASQKARAQNTSPRPTDKKGAMSANAVEARTQRQETPLFAKSIERHALRAGNGSQQLQRL